MWLFDVLCFVPTCLVFSPPYPSISFDQCRLLSLSYLWLIYLLLFYIFLSAIPYIDQLLSQFYVVSIVLCIYFEPLCFLSLLSSCRTLSLSCWTRSEGCRSSPRLRRNDRISLSIPAFPSPPHLHPSIFGPHLSSSYLSSLSIPQALLFFFFLPSSFYFFIFTFTLSVWGMQMCSIYTKKNTKKLNPHPCQFILLCIPFLKRRVEGVLERCGEEEEEEEWEEA